MAGFQPCQGDAATLSPLAALTHSTEGGEPVVSLLVCGVAPTCCKPQCLSFLECVPNHECSHEEKESQGNGARQDLGRAWALRQSSALCRQVYIPGCAPSLAGEDAELWDMLLTGFKFMWGGYCGTAGHYLTLRPQLLD